MRRCSRDITPPAGCRDQRYGYQRAESIIIVARVKKLSGFGLSAYLILVDVVQLRPHVVPRVHDVLAKELLRNGSLALGP